MSSRFAEFCVGYLKKCIIFHGLNKLKPLSLICVSQSAESDIRIALSVQTEQICHWLRCHIEEEACVSVHVSHSPSPTCVVASCALSANYQVISQPITSQ